MSLSELEGVILGIVSTRQPCTAYAVRSRFEQSPTWGWSSSKGAIYPAISRLIGRAVLESRPAEKGRRKSEMLFLTTKGEGELQVWVSSIREEMGGAPVDPIRTRVNYLAALPIGERQAFLDQCEEAAIAALKRATGTVPDPDAQNRWTLHATALGVQMQIEAKLRWLRIVRELALDQGGLIFPEKMPQEPS